MKILITGAKGQLGTELLRQLSSKESAIGKIPNAFSHAELFPVDLEDANLACLDDTLSLFESAMPNIVINCAAFTNVDLCESKQDEAFAGNALSARNVAMACTKTGAKLVHVSTDYVFDGMANAPMPETHPACPQSVYGSTKLLGEEYVKMFCSKWFIARTAWLYGIKGNNIVKTFLKLARENGKLKVVNDQLGNPTSAEDVAHHLLMLASGQEYGTYHVTGNGVCSWYDFACEIVRLSGMNAIVEPCTTAQFPRPAKRPAYSALDNMMLRSCASDEMRPWQEAIADYFKGRTIDEILGGNIA